MYSSDDQGPSSGSRCSTTYVCLIWVEESCFSGWWSDMFQTHVRPAAGLCKMSARFSGLVACGSRRKSHEQKSNKPDALQIGWLRTVQSQVISQATLIDQFSYPEERKVVRRSEVPVRWIQWAAQWMALAAPWEAFAGGERETIAGTPTDGLKVGRDSKVNDKYPLRDFPGTPPPSLSFP